MTFPTDLERLLKEATEGPWYSDGEKIWRRPPSDLYERGGTVAGDKPIAVVQRGWYREGETGYPVEVNAALIALLRNHADAILGLVRAAERALEHAAHKKEADKEYDDLTRASILGGMVISIEDELRDALAGLKEGK